MQDLRYRLQHAIELWLDPWRQLYWRRSFCLQQYPRPLPVRVTQNDLVGMWITVGGDCSRGQHFLSENGKYKKWCFDSISEGEWFLSGGNKIILRHDPKTADAEIITVVRFERYSDHTVLDVRYQNGSREKWMKQ